jgi:hypothetical protein
MNYGNPSGQEEPLLKYSADCERASFLDDDSDQNENSMPKKRRGVKRRKGKRRVKRAKTVKGAKGVRLSKGKVSIRLAGLGVKKLGASQLVKFISLSKLKTAAKKFLSSQGQLLPKKRRKGKRSNR